MIRIGLVGLGKIARDQHLPAIAASADFDLAATASRNACADGVASYGDLAAMLKAEPEMQAVALCQPPQVRHAAARAAIAAGKHVFLEKPPGATLSEVEDLAQAARQAGVTLFASWHSRFGAGVEPARAWLTDKAITGIAIEWKEDVRQWHPGQDWIWQPGGLGVFDPGINALSILTRLLPGPVRLEAAHLEFPSNREAPIAASMALRTSDGAPISAAFDWRQTGRQSWNITVTTDAGVLLLADGGNRLAIDGIAQPLPGEAEYPSLYAQFASLIRDRRSDVDVSPLRLVADAFLTGRRSSTDAFHD
ncbi:Gfo/Idh/MocA family protein [Sphingomonas sp. 35-24ZXX]|uniref:Gfo/Idh/MocA family protein n=1 Tax=Sphingomonas sp. 35-24ZXX TaxID=1545915 RepID=UPI00053BF8A5|nr:Gfo/Idh/MocA family oxidoreductase [Sphingomonas sp. 35-24ZXX]